MLTPNNLVMWLGVLLFLLGMVTFISGVAILAWRASGSDVKAVMAQTARLAQKGVAEDVAGLVGNATDLLDAMNQLVYTMRGVGMFLVIMGMLMMGASCWLALQIYQVQP
jgi:hypothetical protein